MRLAGLLLCASLAACRSEPVDRALLGEPPCDELHAQAPAPRGSLVLIVNDTMRRDAAGVYGGDAHTPHFDRFAREHLLFENAVTQAPWTKPSIATLFTSLHPSQHGVASDPQMRSDNERNGALLEIDVLSDRYTTLAEILSGAGMRTAGFVANPWIDERVGFGQGFERWDDSRAAWTAGGRAIVDAATAWLRERDAEERFFLYVHLIDSHRPYGLVPRADAVALLTANVDLAPLGADGMELFAELRADDGMPLRALGFRPTRSAIRTAYRLGVERFDTLLGRLLASLREHPSWERTAVVVTSDHGEALFERGYGNHGQALFDDEVAIPLAARLPGVTPARGRVNCLVGLIDLMPTLCTHLGVDCPRTMAGWSFLSLAGSEQPAARRWLVTEGVMHRPAHRSVRNGTYKLVYEPDSRGDEPRRESPYALYDLAADPAERLDQLEEPHRSERTERAFEVMRAMLESAVPPYERPPAQRVPVDPAVRERLEALGYLED